MNLTAGALLPTRKIPAIELEDMRTLAEILADPNPIHVDAAAAQAAGIGDRPVTQGPASFGYVLDMLTASAGPRAQVTEFDVRLLGSVFAGDSVNVGGRVERVDGDAVACSVWLAVAGGARVLEGTARLRVPKTN